MDEKMTFTVLNDDGVEVECEVLFTFESDETHKNYIVYTDNTLDEEGNTKVFASVYEPDVDETRLLPIETEREWTMIEMILDQLQESVQRGDSPEEMAQHLDQLPDPAAHTTLAPELLNIDDYRDEE